MVTMAEVEEMYNQGLLTIEEFRIVRDVIIHVALSRK